MSNPIKLNILSRHPVSTYISMEYKEGCFLHFYISEKIGVPLVELLNNWNPDKEGGNKDE